jgi:response regulator RpfG family c-di-GMP phosphodiesterase
MAHSPLPKLFMDSIQPIILIVDDEKHTRDGLRRLLESDYDVYVAGDIASAMNVLEREDVDLKRAERQLPPKVDRYLAQLGDLEMLADLVASTFVDDPLRRQRMLEESSLNQRLRLLITYLQDEIGSAAV